MFNTKEEKVCINVGSESEGKDCEITCDEECTTEENRNTQIAELVTIYNEMSI